MLTFNGSLKIYVALEPCDMRKSFNGLSEIARSHLGLDPLSGAAFLFTNKRRTLINTLLGRNRLLVRFETPRARHL
ncbi:MAG: transposase [Verrucomicrobiales bacterium]|jgi:transposase